MTKMSSGTGSGAPATICYGDILLAEVLDPQGRNPKVRRIVVLTPDAALAAGHPIVGAAVTSTLPNPLTADYVPLPWKNPPGGHPKTGLTKRAAVACHWLMVIDPTDVRGRSGFVPPREMAMVEARTAASARLLGGWP
jgi:mRNA-degrading endonuclease toxin of MazEF toxin-antitoxin module